MERPLPSETAGTPCQLTGLLGYLWMILECGELGTASETKFILVFIFFHFFLTFFCDEDLESVCCLGMGLFPSAMATIPVMCVSGPKT